VARRFFGHVARVDQEARRLFNRDRQLDQTAVAAQTRRLLSAAAEMAPPNLRAQGAALYFFVSSLLSGTLGPTSVALLTDHVFGRDGVRYSLATNTAIGMTIALALFAAGMPIASCSAVYDPSTETT